MVTDKKRKLTYGVLVSVLVISAAYLLFPPQLKLSYVIDDAHVAHAEPQGTWDGMICPQCGSRLERIVIYSDDPQMEDEALRFAYYCRHEDVFWVWNFPGGISSSSWYGPFDAYWKLTNTVATGIVIFSCVALVLLVVRSKGFGHLSLILFQM